MKKITLFVFLLFCTVFMASAQQVNDVYPVSREALESNKYPNSTNRAAAAIYETTHDYTSFTAISATASAGMGDGIVMGGTNRIIKEVTVSLYDISNTLASYDLTISMFTDCNTDGVAGSACGSGPGVLIPGSSQTITVTPGSQIHQVTFLYSGLDVSSETDNEISVVLNSSSPNIGWLTGNSGRTAGSQTSAETGFGVNVFSRCGSPNNSCSSYFGPSPPNPSAILDMRVVADAPLSPPPANDLCANAITITGNGAIGGTTVDASIDTGTPNCGPSISSPGVWYVFTDASGTGSTVDIDLCNGTATFDSKLSVYSGTCGSLVCVTGNDDSCGLQSAVSFTTDGSSTYYILVHSYGGETGAFDLTVNGFPSVVIGTAPIIACPGDIMADTDPGVCGANVSFGNPAAIDPDGGTVTITQTMGDPSGSVFPTGDSIIEFTATDDQGESSTCQFTITVTDTEAPIAVCQNITVDLDTNGSITITAAEVDNGSTDNCSIASMTLDKSTFDCSMTGDNTVTLTITDDSGNSSTCTSTVTVQDVTAPDITCLGGLDTFNETEDFEGSSIPSGWTTSVQVGSYDWTFGSGDMPSGPDFPSNAAIFDDDAAGSGEVNVVSLLSPVYDLSTATSASLSFDYILKDFVGSGFLNVEVYDGTAWQQILLVDNADVGPINSGDIDMMAYANAAFQVRFTYDDEGEWAYGAGIDNFALNYEQLAPGGLDVFLDADGMASINPNDLLSNINEACGYTISAGGVGGGSAGELTTLFASNNGGSAGWAIMYDVTVGPTDIEITDLDVNTDAAAAFNLELYTLEGSYIGNETNPSAWGAPASTGSGTGAGIDQPSNAVLVTPVTLLANTTYGIAIILLDSKPKYTNGTGCPGNQCYDNSELSITLGAAVAGQFTGSVFANRVFNGTIHYVTGAGSGLDFTCADVGANLVEVTVTDDSGNVSTCSAVVNVIDNIAPVLTCGSSNITSEMEDFEGTELPSGWSTEVLTGTDDWMFGSGNMPTGDNFPTNAAIFDDDAAGAGSVNVVRLTSPVYDLTDTSNVTVGYDVAFQESGDQEFKVEVYDGSNWQEIASYDEDLTPNIQTESIDVSAYVNADFQVRFTYDDLGGWGWGAGVDNFNITYESASTSNVVDIELGPDGTTTIDPYSLLSNIEEACGIGTIASDVTTVSCADIGTSIMVTVFVSDTSGNVSSCTTEINVIDLLAPEITCPGDQTVDPGAGNLFYILPDYFATGEATAIDNCTSQVTVTTQDPAVGTGLPDGDHTITLTSTDEYGNTSTCSFVLTVETVLGNSDNALSSGVSLYPNPASSVVNLVNKTDISLKTMTMFDVNGKQVSQVNLTGTQGEKVVDISSLASGVYIVQIVGDKASTVKRLIKE